MANDQKSKGPAKRKPRIAARCLVCVRPVDVQHLGLDVRGPHGGRPHHVDICSTCVRTITEAGITRNLSAIFPGMNPDGLGVLPTREGR